MASYIGASAEQEDADPILMAFAAEATKGDPASPEARPASKSNSVLSASSSR